MKTPDVTQEMMENKKTNCFTYSFNSSKSPEEIFQLVMNIEKWWSGVFEETITGVSQKLNDEFAFMAGGGIHYSLQKLVELVPNKHIAWQVTESNLSFLKNTSEWNGTKIGFNFSKEGDSTKVTFTHDGLVPQFECYNGCAGAWTQYMENLKAILK
jgi:hypothetical protein